MQPTKTGCVYFFRHIGLTPVKIGFSTSESPADRFAQFCTYAPYGSEIIGFIITPTPKELETAIHKKYASKRLSGEWFEISEDDVNYEIDFHQSKEKVRERNEFQIAWAKFIKDRENNINLDLYEAMTDEEKKREFIKSLQSGQKINKTELAERLGVSRQTLHNWAKMYLTDDDDTSDVFNMNKMNGELFTALPEKFTTQQAIEIGSALGIKPQTVKTILCRKKNIYINTGRATYIKSKSTT